MVVVMAVVVVVVVVVVRGRCHSSSPILATHTFRNSPAPTHTPTLSTNYHHPTY